MNASRIPSNHILWILFVLGLGVRLVGINAPPMGMHGWRQADTAAMARNFHENGYDFLHPQVDWGGAGPGTVESEFPAYSYSAALMYGAFGVREWLGRLLSALGFVLGAWALFALVRDTIDRDTALWSTGFFLFLPLGIFYGRAFMPDSWMLAASIAGIYFFHRWTNGERPRDLALSAAFVAFAALLKLPALYLGLPVAYLAWRRFGAGFMRRPALWLYALAVMVPVGLWYHHAHQIHRAGGLTFGIWEYGSDKWGNWSLVASPGFWNGVLFKSLAERWFTWAGFAVLAVGVLLPRRSSAERLFDWWGLALLVYLVIVARGNYVHEYYQLPFLAPGAVYLGKVFARFWRPRERRRTALLLSTALAAMLALGILRVVSYLSKEDPSRAAEAIVAAEVRQRTEPDALILTTNGGSPVLLYLSHRKGWALPESALGTAALDAKRREGARYAAGVGRVPAPLGSDDPGRVLYRSPKGYLIRLD